MPHLRVPTTISDYQTPSGQIPDRPKQAIDGYGGKDFEKRRVSSRDITGSRVTGSAILTGSGRVPGQCFLCADPVL